MFNRFLCVIKYMFHFFHLLIHNFLRLWQHLARHQYIMSLNRMLIFFVSSHVTMLQKYEENQQDRKSTRLNSSHVSISYAVFCLKKKKKTTKTHTNNTINKR